MVAVVIGLRNMKVNRRYLYFYCIKLFLFFVSVLLVNEKFDLGDTDRYVSARVSFTYLALLNSTHFMDFFAGNIARYTNELFAHAVFFHVAFFSKIYLLKVAKFKNNFELLIMALMLLPSVSIWSSVASKETIVIMVTCIITANIISYHKTGSYRNLITLGISIYLLFIFKVQYLPAYLSILVVLYVRSKFYYKVLATSVSFLIILTTMMTVVYVNSNTIDQLALELPQHFSTTARTTRENVYLTESGDIFEFRPDFWFLSFWGVSWTEAYNGFSNLIAFLESCILFGFIGYLLFRRSLYFFTAFQLNILFFSILVFGFFYMIIIHYPMGILNPGSAIRYRSGFIVSVLVFLAYAQPKTSKLT